MIIIKTSKRSFRSIYWAKQQNALWIQQKDWVIGNSRAAKYKGNGIQLVPAAGEAGGPIQSEAHATFRSKTDERRAEKRGIKTETTQGEH